MKNTVRIANLLEDKKPVHMVGISGIGMAGLALLLKQAGVSVGGCDVSPGSAAEWLRDNGINVESGHSADHIDRSVKWIICSAAVPRSLPELVAARDAGLPIVNRGEVLPCLLAGRKSIAVAGTHGKTTTSTFIAQLLHFAGRPLSWCIGGKSDILNGPSGRFGLAANDTIVVEADESDGTLALYHPDISVVTNVEFDHMEHFANSNAFEECFRLFIQNTKGIVIVCKNDQRLTDILASIRDKNIVSYGIDADADITGSDILVANDGSTEFTVLRRGQQLGRLRLNMRGEHNVMNALAAIAVAFECGVSFREVEKGVSSLCLPHRRFEKIPMANNVMVISDYGHHPTEIRALIKTAASFDHKKLRVIFQPHRYTRTLALRADFPPVFAETDELILVPVFSASESPVHGGTTWDLYQQFRTFGAGMEYAAPRVRSASSVKEAWTKVCREMGNGDIVLIVGAGDVEQAAQWAKEGQVFANQFSGDLENRLHDGSLVRYAESMASKTTLGVGGIADVWVDAQSESDIRAVLAWSAENKMTTAIVGAGSNLLIDDMGFHGVAIRLSGEAFSDVKENDGIVTVGSGVSISALLKWCEHHGWSGLEFMEGIPGTVGGALVMNAGAQGCAITEVVSWIRCLNSSGSECMLDRDDVGGQYRESVGLAGMIVLEAGFCLEKEDCTEIHNRREEFNARRQWMKGLRSAGSVFKNPGGAEGRGENNAGWLIENTGLKGLRVGGASVSTKHANIIVTERTANASDVRALVEIIRAEVMLKFDVKLDMEIRILG
ncbi:MAG: UDP-N-acetylmuramate--L-alanine ligase [Lentisphaerae bacterium]|nr:UDP-N-acetylmuramate--L-alanine ligase [Lentisphaerota bacterium]